jgi:hypothetical protein
MFNRVFDDAITLTTQLEHMPLFAEFYVVLVVKGIASLALDHYAVRISILIISSTFFLTSRLIGAERKRHAYLRPSCQRCLVDGDSNIKLIGM